MVLVYFDFDFVTDFVFVYWILWLLVAGYWTLFFAGSFAIMSIDLTPFLLWTKSGPQIQSLYYRQHKCYIWPQRKGIDLTISENVTLEFNFP